MEDTKTVNETEEVVKETEATAEKSENKTKEQNAKKSDENKKTKKKSKEEILIESLQSQVMKLQAETQKDREDYLKARADLENVRRRVQEDAIQDRKYASLGLVSDLVQPLDMLIKASSMVTEDQQMKNFLIGFQMIANQLSDVLKRDGLAEIEAKGKEFDPNIHQAISKEHVDGVEPGIVLEVLQSGFKYKDRIIKPAMVKVSE